jgi:hypothetical protein
MLILRNDKMHVEVNFTPLEEGTQNNPHRPPRVFLKDLLVPDSLVLKMTPEGALLLADALRSAARLAMGVTS